MSVKALSHVWEFSAHKGARLLVLLALADAANDDGFSWLSIANLAKKARQTRSNTQRYVQDLAASGELILYERLSYTEKKNLSNVYKLVIPGTNDTLPADLKGVIRPRVVGSRKIKTTPKTSEKTGNGSRKNTATVVVNLRSDPLQDPSIKENYISDASNTTLEGRNVAHAIEEKISDGNDTVATRSAEHTVTAAAREADHTPSREAVEKQAETAPPESSAKAPPAEPSPACTPTREQRDAMFEAVCGHIFGVVGKDNIREMARSEHSRAGKIVSWLLKQSDGFAPNGSKKAARVVVGWISAPAQPEHVEKFAAQYKQKHRDASLPLDIMKFTDAWRAWASELARESRRKAARAQQAEARQAERPQATPEERAAMKAQLQAARNSLKAERTDA